MSQFGPQLIIILIFLSLIFTSGGFTPQAFIQNLVFGFPAILIGFSFHEFAHAFVADRLGDPTPRSEGRVTLDIRKHIDPIGILLVILFQFGWAKPVMINTRNFKNPKLSMALIGVAGPLMNLLIAIIATVVLFRVQMSDKVALAVYYIYAINTGLAAFNLIPVPPLDGSRVIGAFMTNKMYYKFVEFEYKYASILMIAVFIFVYNFFSKPMQLALGYIETIGYAIANILPF